MRVLSSDRSNPLGILGRATGGKKQTEERRQNTIINNGPITVATCVAACSLDTSGSAVVAVLSVKWFVNSEWPSRRSQALGPIRRTSRITIVSR